MQNCLDTYYSTIVSQMTKVDATQAFGGILEARDWPLTPPISGALYLLFLSAAPVGGTMAQALYEYFLQFTWLIIGDDVGITQQAQNRANRYRQGVKIMENLRQAHAIQYTQKQSVVSDSQGNLTFTPTTTTYPRSELEMIWWTRPRFAPRNDNQKSGLYYGAAAISLFAYEDVLPALVA